MNKEILDAKINNFVKYYPMLKQFVGRDFKVKYRRSVLGVLWSVLNPLGIMLIMTIVFSSIFQQQIVNFPVYFMCGQLTFNFFNEASSSAMNSIIWNGNLIQKVYFPKYLLPLSSVCSALVNLLTSMIALLVVILITRTPITNTIFLSVFPVLYTWIFSFGIGLVLAVIATSFRDMQHLYGVIITGWMYLTPIFYPLSALPQSVAKIVMMNPITRFVEMIRKAVLYNQIPTFKEHVMCIMICSITVFFGLIIFRKYQDEFILKL